MSDARSRAAVAGTALLLVLALVATAHLAGRPRRDVVGAATGRVVTITPVAVPMAPALPAIGHRRRAIAVDLGWATRTAARTGIPVTAMLAYGRATLRSAEQAPGCRLGWTTLAGIGYVESEHGTLGGRTLAPDGRSSLPVLGPALDGGSFAAVRSTQESVRWHGDARWDHAVGPMQFIPSTWSRWASDGDADGISDPNDLFDASWATARYLCSPGGDLTDGAAWTGAVLSYNHSDAYVAAVLLAANTYARR